MADGLHFLSLAQLGFEADPFGDVFDHEEEVSSFVEHERFDAEGGGAELVGFGLNFAMPMADPVCDVHQFGQLGSGFWCVPDREVEEFGLEQFVLGVTRHGEEAGIDTDVEGGVGGDNGLRCGTGDEGLVEPFFGLGVGFLGEGSVLDLLSEPLICGLELLGTGGDESVEISHLSTKPMCERPFFDERMGELHDFDGVEGFFDDEQAI